MKSLYIPEVLSPATLSYMHHGSISLMLPILLTAVFPNRVCQKRACVWILTSNYDMCRFNLISLLVSLTMKNLYSTPNQSKSGLVSHMTRLANHRRHSCVI